MTKQDTTTIIEALLIFVYSQASNVINLFLKNYYIFIIVLTKGEMTPTQFEVNEKNSENNHSKKFTLQNFCVKVHCCGLQPVTGSFDQRFSE